MTRAASDQTVYESHGSGRRQLIAWCIPTLGRVSTRFMSAHYALAQPANAAVVHLYVEGLEIGDARNDLVAKALAFDNDEREVTHVFFMDDDVLPHPMAFKKLHADNRDIVSGLYFLKTVVPTPMVLSDETEPAKSWRPGDIVECAGHGMGLTLIRTEVFKRLRDETDLGVDGRGNPKWFTTLKDERIVRIDGARDVVNETEDVYFLRRARALGYRPCVDTSAEAFGWHWEQREQRAYPIKQWIEWQRDGRISWLTDKGEAVVWENVA